MKILLLLPASPSSSPYLRYYLNVFVKNDIDYDVYIWNRSNDIIEDIKAAGFSSTDTYVTPNQYEIAIKNLRQGQNDRGYIKSCVKQFRKLIEKYGAEKMQDVYDLLSDRYLLEEYTAKKEAILETYDILKPYFEKFYTNKPKKRYVDFNQGIESVYSVEFINFM